ncbi:hypothetical protein, partial [Citrobacter portucalensis]|uniref:hypothetical protein n=1 Tax=Citrobacter portucalensis TaxID=1639133 RepID=UPI00226B9840
MMDLGNDNNEVCCISLLLSLPNDYVSETLQTGEGETAAVFSKSAQRTLAADVHPLSDAEPPAPERTVRMMTPPASPEPEIKTVHRSA